MYRFRPGLTGWAQINGRDSISLLRKMKLDKEYCDNWSLKLDLIILLRSVGAVVKQEGSTRAPIIADKAKKVLTFQERRYGYGKKFC